MKKIIMILMMVYSCITPINSWAEEQVISSETVKTEGLKQAPLTTEYMRVKDQIQSAISVYVWVKLQLDDIDGLVSQIETTPDANNAFLNRDDQDMPNTLGIDFVYDYYSKSTPKLITAVEWKFNKQTWTVKYIDNTWKID